VAKSTIEKIIEHLELIEAEIEIVRKLLKLLNKGKKE